MASSSSAGYVSRYDVFLSFRGEDTRDSFTDHLYQALRRAGLYTFRDNDSISRGEDLQPRIEEGIRESRASIIVLSAKYATSRWCLDELCLILEQRKERHHFVLPIFYHVDPSHIRKQEGTFQINVVPNTKWTDDNVKRWKAALEKVGQMTGKVAISGPETIFLGEVVDIIKQRLDLKQVYRKGNLVGMETRDKEINSWLEQSDSNIFAIWGMPGSGKTTLAEHIVYSNWHKFESHSILQDIGSSSTDQYLRQLQKRLIKVITEGKPRKILSVSHGTCIIEEALRNKKALIVLGDIVTKKQLDALIGTGITTKSKIIITTRERNSSKWFQSTSWRCQEHEMKLLDDGDSLELLSLYAFEPNAPINGYEELMKRALVYCGGNPLALQVLGSSLKGSQGSWESTLTLFEREVPGNLQEVLIKSYNSLQQNIQKQLFLHIACFFIGKDKEYVEKILGPDYCAKSEIVNLTNSCLLSVSPNNKLMMHQLLLAMARKIVDEESQTHPENRSRVWRDSESYNVLKKEKGSTNVKGLALDMEVLGKQQIALGKKQLSDVVNTRSFENMDSLQLLKLNQLKLTGTYQNIFKELRWLCWREFFLEAIPPELDMENLVAIDMSCSKLKVFQPPDVLPLLQILNLADSHNLVEVQNISRVPKLDTLVLENCRSLVRFCHTLGDLTSLTSLNLTGCENLCNGIQPQFVFPSSLKQLFLMDCNLKDTHFSPAFYSLNNQPHLEYLNLAVNLCKLLPSYTHLKNIQTLDLSSCTALKKLLYLPSNLTELYIFDCSSLETVTFDLHKFTLQEFRYEGCVNLSEVEDFFKLLPVASLTGDQLKHMNWLRAYQDLEVCLVGDDDLTKGRTLHLEMLYEFNIMSISLPDIEKPNMIPENEYTSEDPILSFDIPESHRNRKLRGLNLTFKYTLQGDEWVWFAKIRTNNGVDLIYNAKVFGKPAANEVGIWLSYWPIGESLHDGDEVNVAIVVTKGLEIHGCGASLVYTDEEDEIESFEDGNESMVDANEICEDNDEPTVDANEIFEDNDEPFEDNTEHAGVLGADISRYKLCTGTYYLCRRDYSQLMEVGRLTLDWFKNLVGDTIDYTEIGGWRKTGKPDQPYQSFTELKTIGCIIYGPQLEEFYTISELSKSPLVEKIMEEELYKIEELSKSSLSDKTEEYTPEFSKDATKDADINEMMASTSSVLAEQIEHSRSHISIMTIKREKMEAERDSVKLILDNELIRAAHIQSTEAHKHNEPYLTNNTKHVAGSSSSSMEVMIFAFKGPSEVDDWYQDDGFGHTRVDEDLFPSLQSIIEHRPANVNGAFLRIFQDLLNNRFFKLEVQKAVMVDEKNILFTGHSSGGAIASFATLWMLDEYTRKRGIKSPIGCITFGSPLIGDETLSHAVQREKWAGHFTHFVMEHDIVPRIMLAPKTSIQEHLPKILKFFQQNIKPTTSKPYKISGLFSKKTPDRTIDNDQLLKPDEAVSFFKNMLINVSIVAEHAFLMRNLSADFVQFSPYSPYRPFGGYVFCTCDKDQDPTETRQFLFVDNPKAVLQLLFYFLQLPNEDQDLVEFAVNSLAESFSYGEELNKNGLQLQNMVHLKDLNKQLLRYDGNTDDVVHTSNKALFELDRSARMCLMAIEEDKNRKKENEERIKTSMRKYQTQTAKNEQRVIEAILDEIRNYKEKTTNKNMDYYEVFKLQNNEDDFRAKVNMLELAKIYDKIIEMVMNKDLPDEFEVWDEWVDLATLYRRLVEPLEIATFYRHSKGGISYILVRPKRYKFTQRWYELANAKGFEMISESNFIAEVEQLKREIEEPRNTTLEEIKARFESIKVQVQKWKSDDKIPNEDVYWGESALSMLEEKLS